MGAPYIYDISSLRVNDLTFILLTWRKWLAPNNASRQQMGFNSGFKGLMPYRPAHKLVLIPLPASVLFPSAGCPVSLVTEIVTGKARYV
jgi:hypothetical protein